MAMRSGVPALVSALALLAASTTDAFNVKLINACGHSVQMFDARSVENINAGGSISRWIAPNSGAHVFRHTTNAQATLAEFSGDGGMAWFDISIIPTGPKSGPDYCPSLDACKQHTGGVGYNVAMQIRPVNTNNDRCRTLTCLYDGCPDAYQYPKDDTKTHTCPLWTDFEVTFCPGGPTAPPTPPPTPPPTAAPTPEPTPAPTPEPTPEPTPAPTPEPSVEAANESGLLASSGSTDLDVGASADDENREAGVIETVATATEAPETPAPTEVETPVGTPEPVVEANTQSEASAGGGGFFVAVGVIGAVAMVAGAAIHIVRKKKAELEAMDLKTPDPRQTIADQRSTMMRTPQNFIDVL